MINGLIDKARQTATRKAREIALKFIGGGIIAVGTAFLTFAFWLFLSSVTTDLKAALFLGVGYIGIGLAVVLVLAPRLGETTKKPEPNMNGETVADLFAAFNAGVKAGQKTRS